MNTLKTVVITIILMAACYWVYSSLWLKPEKTTADDNNPDLSTPTTQFPGSPDSTPTLAIGGGQASASPPGTLGAPAPLFGTNSPNAKATITPAEPRLPGGSNNVTIFPPAPGLERAPVSPSLPAPSMMPNTPSPATMAINGSAGPNDSLTQDDFREQYLGIIKEIEKVLDAGKLPEALQSLTRMYEMQDLPNLQRREIEQLLDQLAGTVIYSPQSYLNQPYTVQQGDTLDSIAQRSNVPSLLLARINNIDPQQAIQPGQSMKVLHGPFSAVVNLERHELMLKLQGGYYAGRFPIAVGTDISQLEGTYTVREKTQKPIYHAPDGASIAHGDQRNPLGKYWIGLGDRIGLHGTPNESSVGQDVAFGVISLKERDIDDLYGILSVGSQVIIRR
jgi:LysM repeat protein